MTWCSSLREIFIINGEGNMTRCDKIILLVMEAKNTLTSIDFSPSFPNLSNLFFEKIGEITQLSHLAVGGGNLGASGILALACLPELKTLKVPGIVCGRFGAHSNDMAMAEFVDLFSKLKKLELVEINMDDNFPSDEVVKSLVHNNPNLHHLDITAYPKNIARPYLLHSYIDNLSSRSLILIADKCPQLTHIGIGHLIHFSGTSITQLVTNCPKLIYANFEDTNFNDTALAKMSENCPDLEYLNISGCGHITGGALERFANPATTANLKKLLVSQRYYSPQLLKRLEQNRPNVEISVIYDDEDSSDEDSSDSMYDSDDIFHGDYSSDSGEDEDEVEEGL